MKKKAIVIFSLLLLGTLVWYVFIKKDDYIFTFKANTSAGTVVYLAKKWNTIKDKSETATIKTIESNPFKELYQEVTEGDKKFIFRWSLSYIDDNTTKIQVGVTEKGGNKFARLLIPFKEILPAKLGKEKLLSFNKIIQDHLKNFKISIDGDATFPGGFYAYIPLESTLKDKAEKMILNNAELTTFLAESEMPIVGYPILEVTHWDQEEDRIKFNFCFPVDKKDSLPEHSQIRFKNFEAKKSLKATFNGNYRISDRSWFALQANAEDLSIDINKRPIEVFYNNPNNGGNELEWKAEIFMPLN